MTLQAYKNDPDLKAKIVATAQWHVDQDHLIRGDYGIEGPDGQWRGCAVGCTIHSATGDMSGLGDHTRVPELLGLPEWLMHLMDWCFETMDDDRETLVVRVLESPPVGASLDAALHRILARFQREVVVEPTETNHRVAQLHDRQAAGDFPSDDEWSAAESAARSAAESAAWSAARSAAESAAWSAAWSAAMSAAWSAAMSAARSAAMSAAWSAAESAAATKCANIIIDEIGKPIKADVPFLRKGE